MELAREFVWMCINIYKYVYGLWVHACVHVCECVCSRGGKRAWYLLAYSTSNNMDGCYSDYLTSFHEPLLPPYSFIL